MKSINSEDVLLKKAKELNYCIGTWYDYPVFAKKEDVKKYCGYGCGKEAVEECLNDCSMCCSVCIDLGENEMMGEEEFMCLELKR